MTGTGYLKVEGEAGRTLFHNLDGGYRVLTLQQFSKAMPLFI